MPAPSHPTRRVDGSMSLLVDMASNALDPAYGDAAERRLVAVAARTASRPSGRWRRVPVLLTCALSVAGVLGGVALAQVRDKAGVTVSQRRSLVNDVRRETRETDQLSVQIARLQRDVAGIRDRALGDDARGRATAEQVAALELATGGVAVQGPGLLVTLDDAPDAAKAANSSRGGQLGDGRIYDRDLQDVVNALWAVGAEAISINGQRLTAQTAIRSAGEAVLVDFRPLSPPYVLRAVGDVERMEPAFVDGMTARRFRTWTSLYGLGFDVARAKNLRLPAAGTADIRLAHPEGAS